MTNEQETALRNFEAQVRQLMMAYEKLRLENAELAERLAQSDSRLSEAKTEIESLKREYEILRTARIIEVSGEDVKKSRAKLSKLIREVDKCIALLDV